MGPRGCQERVLSDLSDRHMVAARFRGVWHLWCHTPPPLRVPGEVQAGPCTRRRGVPPGGSWEDAPYPAGWQVVEDPLGATYAPFLMDTTKKQLMVVGFPCV